MYSLSHYKVNVWFDILQEHDNCFMVLQEIPSACFAAADKTLHLTHNLYYRAINLFFVLVTHFDI